MIYVANPVNVTAHKIVKICKVDGGGNRELRLENGTTVMALQQMCSRMLPKPGDYWVIQEDGYIYLNPKEVFERKYSLMGSTKNESASSKR